jgi:hypothetical protein
VDKQLQDLRNEDPMTIAARPFFRPLVFLAMIIEHMPPGPQGDAQSIGAFGFLLLSD